MGWWCKVIIVPSPTVVEVVLSRDWDFDNLFYTRISRPDGPLKILAPAESLLASLTKIFASLTKMFASLTSISSSTAS